MPLNGPFWSLFLELWIANLLYAVTFRWLGGRWLYALFALCAAGLLFCEYRFGALAGGWHFNQAGVGLLRVGFSFSAGVAICRLNAAGKIASFRLPSIALLGALALMLCAPVFYKKGQVVEVLIVLVFSPLLIGLGMGAKERRPKIGCWLGDMSYAAYALHWPVLQMLTAFCSGSIHQHRSVWQLAFVVAVAAGASTAAIADERFRGWLKRRRLEATGF